MTVLIREGIIKISNRLLRIYFTTLETGLWRCSFTTTRTIIISPPPVARDKWERLMVMVWSHELAISAVRGVVNWLNRKLECHIIGFSIVKQRLKIASYNILIEPNCTQHADKSEENFTYVSIGLRLSGIYVITIQFTGYCFWYQIQLNIYFLLRQY